MALDGFAGGTGERWRSTRPTPPPPHLDTVWKEPLWIPAIGFHLGSCSALKACGREVTLKVREHSSLPRTPRAHSAGGTGRCPCPTWRARCSGYRLGVTLDSCAARQPRRCSWLHAFLRASDSGCGAAVHAAHAELAAQRDSWQVSFHCFRLRQTSLLA